MAIVDIKLDGLFKNLLEALGGAFKKKDGAKQAILDFIMIRDIARNIVHNGGLSVDCFLIMMVHNGGKKLTPHNFAYRSVVNGFHNEMTMPNFDSEDYRHLEIDYEYALLISEVIKKKEVSMLTVNMGDSKLSLKMRFERLKYSRFMYLFDDNNAVWYILAGTTQSNEEFDTVTHRHEFNIAINKIRNMIKKY